MEFLRWVGEHPILFVIILVVIFAGTGNLIQIIRGDKDESGVD